MTPIPIRSLALKRGANDYVTKPFRFAVLLARIRAQLRQHENSEDATFYRGAIYLQACSENSGRRIRRQGADLPKKKPRF